MFAALGYAVLAAILVEQLRHIAPTKISAMRGWPKPIPSTSLLASLVLGAVVLLGLASGFPLLTGAVVPGPRATFPSDHVKVPNYWLAAANYLNTSAPPGSLLVLPPDDFYAMPYSWYYGSDGFIANLVERHVLDPSAQSYNTVSTTLLSSVRLEASALLAHDWTEASRLLQALGTPLVLVRGDIVADFAGRHIVSPTALAASLARDPNMRLLQADGLLKVYGPRKTYRMLTRFATVNTSDPDLRVLSRLPSSTALVTTQPIPGHIAIVQLPPVAAWHVGATALSTTVREKTGWKYSALVLGLHSGSTDAAIGLAQRQVLSPGASPLLQIRLPVGSSLVQNGNFAAGPWGAVANCDDSEPVSSPNFLRAEVLPRAGPGRTPALQLAASIDAACEARQLTWRTGPILLELWVRSRSGEPPQLCLWQTPIDRCATTALLPGGSQWHLYRATVFPAPGTETISLFLYAYPQSFGQGASVEQYSGVIVRSLPRSPVVDVVGRPTTSVGSVRLRTYATGYAPGWVGPPGATHVLVDGLRNGWLTTVGTRGLQDASYQPILNEGRDELVLVGAMLLLAVGGVLIWRSNP